MKRLLTKIKRASLIFQIRTMESTVDGQTECLECVRDPLIRRRILLAREEARRELATLRSRYVATLPPGKRLIWCAA